MYNDAFAPEEEILQFRAPDKGRFSFLKCLFLHQILFDRLLESSQRDDSNKWSNIEFCEEIGIIEIKIGNLSGALGLNI